MSRRTWIILGAAAVAVVAFVVWRKRSAPAPAVKPPAIPVIPRNEADCRARGGVWGPVNRSARTNTCNFPRF